MNVNSVVRVRLEAKKFLKQVKIVEDDYKRDSHNFMCGTKETGALRRRSMDLTRALADLRKS